MLKEFIFPKKYQENFISGWLIPENICDDLVEFYQNDKTFPITRGCVGTVGNIKTDVKDSYDMAIPVNHSDSRILNYCTQLQKCAELYCKKYEYAHADHSTSWTVIENMILQFYKPNGGFKLFHYENDGIHAYRHLVFMTYLNDVPGGGTEFKYQNLITPAVKGLTIIWPAVWTHTHRGQISKEYEKYIITGWFSFVH